MRKVRVRDAQGARWMVRARRLRATELAGPITRPEQESLRRRLSGALAPQPAVLVDPLRGIPGAWRTPGDTADIELREARAAYADATYVPIGGLWAFVVLVPLVRDSVDHLRTPMTDTWRLEAAARGRIRRWARWEVPGVEDADRAVGSVAAALTSGRVPTLDDAILVEVVDQRPPTASRRSAFGEARVAG